MSATFLCSQGNVQVRLGDDLVLTFIDKEPGQHHNQIPHLQVSYVDELELTNTWKQFPKIPNISNTLWSDPCLAHSGAQ